MTSARILSVLLGCFLSSSLLAQEPAPCPSGGRCPPRASQADSEGLLITKVQPLYPEDARQARIQGQVVLHALIDKHGKIKELTVVSGHPMLVPAAMKAVKKWRYKPFLVENHPVLVETSIVVNFALSAN